VTLRLALFGLIVLLAPVAGAAPTSVSLTEAGGVWNGDTAIEGPFDDGVRTLDLWLPSGARVQGVDARTTNGTLPLAWRASGPQSIRVSLEEIAPADVERLEARFDFQAAPPLLATFVAPAPTERLDLRVAPPAGLLVQGERATFAPGPDGAYVATLHGLHEGARVPMRLIEEGRVGELPVLGSVAGIAVVGLALGTAWHRLRPPHAGREPQRFVEHLAELQARLLPPVVLFGLLNVLYFTMGLRLVERRGFDVIVPSFGVDASLSARAFDAFAERLVPEGVQLVVTRPADAVLAQIETALFLAFLSTLPLLVYEIAAFLGPALTPRERGVALRAIPLVSFLFLAGALFGLLAMAPLMIRTLYGYAPSLGAAPLLVVQELVSFALLVLFVFGIAFELPVVMYVLARLGMVQAATFRRYWRHAVVAIVLLAGLLTPDPSVISQGLVAVPLLVLYGLGIGAARWGERARGAP
jgi:sec-independent protein translocase protein TatC